MEDTETQEESGKGLRGQLETALKRNSELDSELRKLRGKDLLGSGKFRGVTEEDLKDVSLDDLEARASAIAAERLASEKKIAETFYAKQGLDGEALTKAVEDHFSENSEVVEQVARQERVQSLLATPGMPPSQVPRLGFEEIFSKQAKK